MNIQKTSKHLFKWFTYFWYWRQWSRLNYFQWYPYYYFHILSYYFRSLAYIPPNRKIIFKEQIGVIHEHNTKINLAMIKKEAEIFGLLFLEDGATILRCQLLNILASGKTYWLLYYNVDFQGNFMTATKNMKHLFVINSWKYERNWPNQKITR